MKSFQLREQSQTKITEARATEDAVKANELFTEAKALAERANQLDEMEALERSFDQVVNKREVEDRSAKSNETAEDAEVRNFTNWLRTDVRAGQTIANGANNAVVGGNTVPTSIHDKIIKNAVTVGPMLSDVFDLEFTATGSPRAYALKKGSRRGRMLGETASANQVTQTLGTVTIGAHKMTTDEAITSRELLQDSAVDIAEWLVSELGEAYGLGANYELTMGPGGTDRPVGIVTALTPEAYEAAVLDSDEVLKLQYEVNDAYRARGVYMFNSKTELALRLLKDAEGRPIWQPAFSATNDATIHGKRYIINDDMPDFGSGGVCVIFGDPKSYKVRVARQLTIEKTGLHVLTDQVSWVGFARFDGALIRLDGLKGLKKEA